MVRQFIDAEPVRVCGFAACTRSSLPQPNDWLGAIEFANGSIARLGMAWLHPSGDTPFELNFDAQLAVFVDAVRRRTPPSPNIEDGYQSLALTLALDKAIRTRRVIELTGGAR